MNTTQVYSLINAVYGQMNEGDTLANLDPAGLVAFGDSVLSSSTNTEAFLNTLAQRIGRTIIRFRAYSNAFKGLVKDSFEWGAILQKVSIDMPAASADDSYNLVDGQSIDPYIVKKPVVNQKLYVVRAPYSFYITIQEAHLKEAFLSAEAMGSFISAIFGEIQNKLETTMEDLGRVCLDSAIVNTSSAQRIHLLTDYNTNSGIATPLTATTALFDEGFLRYAIGQIKIYSMRMRGMSTLYNKDGKARFSAEADQRYAVLADFQNALETQVQYAAFNQNFVSKDANIVVPYWQSADSPFGINMDDKSGSAVALDSVVAVLFDKDACGIYKEERNVATTPLNARGLYYNQFHHHQDSFFVDESENMIVLCLD